MAEHGDEEGVGNELADRIAKREDDPDRIGPPEPQVARHLVELEAMLTREIIDPVARPGTDHLAAGKRPRHGRRRNPREASQIRYAGDRAFSLSHGARHGTACPA